MGDVALRRPFLIIMNPQPVFGFEQPHEEAREREAARLAAEHVVAMAEWQARVDAMIAEREARRKAKAEASAARTAARAIAKIARDNIRAEQESAKNTRRWHREEKARAKNDTLTAQCGINWYNRRRDAGIYWTHCRTCGQELIYSDDPNAEPQQCQGRRA